MALFLRGLQRWRGRQTLTKVQARTISSGRDRFFQVSEEVQDAVDTGKPVVALETTIYTHGYPYPENISLASRLESLVRVNGGIPATIGVLNGVARVGMEPEDLLELISTAGSENTWKLSRRDLGFIGGLGLRGRKLNGGTTIAGTMILAHLAGIRVFATGGLGGVHRGGENSMDISADLTELGRTPVTVISSGCKSFLDIPKTLEYLETQGVGVGTFADGRDGKVDFPAFWARDSGYRSPQTIRDEVDAASIIYAQNKLPLHSGLLFANPVPGPAAIAAEEINSIIARAVEEAKTDGISGSANTPYVLKRIRDLTNGASVTANTALVEANVVRGTKVAVELAKIELRGGIAPEGSTHRSSGADPQPSSSATTSPRSKSETISRSSDDKIELLVAGTVASDTICDYRPVSLTAGPTPVAQTSNPASISQSAGGVGRNVAVAARLAGVRVGLASAVANDIAGKSLVDQLEKDGISTSLVRTLSIDEGSKTAQYVAVNDAAKDLMLAMADMDILAAPELHSREYWIDILSSSSPKWLAVDANWPASSMSNIFAAAKQLKTPAAFEPVSVAKCIRLFDGQNAAITSTGCVPEHVVNLATPNLLELHAMYRAAREAGLFHSESWWTSINSLGMSGMGSREKLVMMTSAALVEDGLPQQCIQLLPYIPNLVTKLGPQGCLLTQLLRPNDLRLRDPTFAPYILSRSTDDSSPIGGVYIRSFPPASLLAANEIVSVNGIGDTMLGVIMAGLVKGWDLDRVIPVAQDAAVISLGSSSAVSPDVRRIASQFG